MWIVRLALRRPYSVATLCLLILLMGYLALRRMPVDIFPAIDIPVVVVVWNYNGLSAEDMERRIVYISERSLSTSVSGISSIESQSLLGIGILRVYFEQGADIGGAIAQITSSLLTATRSMPPGIQPPVILQFNASNVPVGQLTVSSHSLSEQQLYDYGLNFLRLRLFTVPGLSTPAPYGGSTRQVSVDIDPARLAAKGLSPADVVQAVLSSNVIVPAGSVRLGTQQLDVLLNSSPATAAAFNDIPIKVVNGVPIYMGDVAHVYDGYAVQTNIARINGSRATYLAILKKADASTLAVIDATRDMIPLLKAQAPQGLELRLDFDQSVFVRAAIHGVLREALIAALLVSVMIFGFLGSWRSMVVVCVSIPLSIMFGIVGLFLTGQTLNIMTLGGLALAIGMLVDDATVEVENINRNRPHFRELTMAIVEGARQVAVPALAATFTICIVFFPVVQLQGPARFLFAPLALSVVFSMLASYLLSRTLVPTLARLLMDKEHIHDAAAPGRGLTRGARFNEWRDARINGVRDGYGRVLDVVLSHRSFVLVIFGLVAAAALVLAPSIGVDFFPSIDSGQMRIHLRAPAGTRLEQTESLVSHAEQRIRAIVPARELVTVNSDIGIPTFYNLAFNPSDNIGEQDADIRVALAEKHHPTEEYVARIRLDLARELPGSIIYFQAADIVSQVLNFGVPAPIDVQVEGRDVEAAHTVALDILRRLRLVSGVADAHIAQTFDHPALYFDVDRSRAAQLGVSQRDVATSLLTTLSSSTLLSPSFWVNPENNVNYFVAVQTPIYRLQRLSDVLSIPVTPGSAGLLESPALPTPPVLDTVPSSALTAGAPGPTFAVNSPYLGSLAALSRRQDRSLISHSTVQPVIDVQCSVEGRDLGAVTSDIHRMLAKLGKLPADVEVRVRGQSESMVASFTSFGLGLVVAIMLVYLLLVVLFQSWIDPFIIMMAIPGAMVGILFLLSLTGTTLNVESFMGSIMAVGIAASNSILLVNFANDVRVERGLDARAAALEAGRMRLRPVIMTALAMILGMLPMALSLGEGGEQNAPLGRAVIGGLIAATIVTLFVVPVVYSLLRKAEPRKHQLDEQFAAQTRA